MEIRDVLANLEKLVGPYTMQKPEVLLVSQEEYRLLLAHTVENADVLGGNLDSISGVLWYRGVKVLYCLSNKELLEDLYESVVKKALVSKEKGQVVFDDFDDYVSDQDGPTVFAYWKNETIDQLPEPDALMEIKP